MKDIPTPAISTLKLAELYLHPMNPRQNGDDADSAAMAASIATCGLMQNLLGYADPDRPGIGIVAGGRRLRGLQHLAEHGVQLMDSRAPHPGAIPVLVTDDAFTARAWAAAESETQRALHPADEIRAYRAMRDQGNGAEAIARAFAKTIRHVRGRIALAGLPDLALDALKAGKLTLDAAQVLTLARDPAQMEDTARQAVENDWPIWKLREHLMTKRIRSTDRRARLVGIDAYRDAGGPVTEDLFADHTWIDDEKLLDRLFAAKLAAETERLREDGSWSWAKPVTEPYIDRDDVRGLVFIEGTEAELPDGDLEDLARLEGTGEDNLDDADRARLADLRSRAEVTYTDDDRARGGIITVVTFDGRLIVEGAYMTEGADPDADGDTGDDAPATHAAPEKTAPPIPANALSDLRRIALLALQTAALDKTEVLLDLFAWQLQRRAPGWVSPFAIEVRDPVIAPDTDGAWHVDERLTAAAHDIDMSYRDTDPLTSFTAFRDMGRKHRNQVLTHHLARLIHAGDTGTDGVGQLLRQLVAFDAAAIRRVWTPDAATYFGRIRADRLDGLWAELLQLEPDDPRIAEFAALKKAQKAGALERLFTDMDAREAHGISREQGKVLDAWLPEELREGVA